jgi:hypothetical protein
LQLAGYQSQVEGVLIPLDVGDDALVSVMARRAGFAAAADGGSVTAGELAVFINRLAGVTTGDKRVPPPAAGLCASQADAAPAVSGAVPPLLRQLDHMFVGAAAMMFGRALATPDALG